MEQEIQPTDIHFDFVLDSLPNISLAWGSQ